MEQNYFSFNIIPVSNTDNDNRHITHSKTFLMLTPAPKYTGLHLSQLLRVTFLLSLNRPDCALLGKMSGVFVKKCLLGIKGKERPQHAETLWNRNAETLLSNALFNWGIPLKWPRQDPLLFFFDVLLMDLCVYQQFGNVRALLFCLAHSFFLSVFQVVYLQQAEVNREKVSLMDQSSVDGVQDMSMLAELHEAAIMHNLHQRYQKDCIYVRILQTLDLTMLHETSYYCMQQKLFKNTSVSWVFSLRPLKNNKNFTFLLF